VSNTERPAARAGLDSPAVEALDDVAPTPLLKRLSDRFDEECEALVAEGDDPENKVNHQFFVPKRARWSQIQKVATDLGATLNKACSQLNHGARSSITRSGGWK
jgi:hypothetical protein